MCGNDNRVHIHLGLCAVTAFSFYGDVYFIGRGHVFPRPKAHLAGIDQGHYMLSQYGLWFRVFQHAFFDHEAGATGQFFFGGLKDEFYGTGELAF